MKITHLNLQRWLETHPSINLAALSKESGISNLDKLFRGDRPLTPSTFHKLNNVLEKYGEAILISSLPMSWKIAMKKCLKQHQIELISAKVIDDEIVIRLFFKSNSEKKMEYYRGINFIDFENNVVGLKWSKIEMINYLKTYESFHDLKL